MKINITKDKIQDILLYPVLINPIWIIAIICFVLYTCTLAWFKFNGTKDGYTEIVFSPEKHNKYVKETLLGIILVLFNTFYWNYNYSERIVRLFEHVAFSKYKPGDWRYDTELKQIKKYLYEKRK